MKRLIIHLKKVDKIGNKIYNTLNYIIKNQDEENYFLTKHHENISSYKVSFFK